MKIFYLTLQPLSFRAKKPLSFQAKKPLSFRAKKPLSFRAKSRNLMPSLKILQLRYATFRTDCSF